MSLDGFSPQETKAVQNLRERFNPSTEPNVLGPNINPGLEVIAAKLRRDGDLTLKESLPPTKPMLPRRIGRAGNPPPGAHRPGE